MVRMDFQLDAAMFSGMTQAIGNTRFEGISPRGFEPLTFGSGGQRSIQLSYGDRNPSGCYLTAVGEQVKRATVFSFRRCANGPPWQ